ncbi:MAG: SH3 domain-containing protein [Methyloceanibacter sp.]|uniref:SH3 domain-containing protein n=1 Tax=Methyloceanibacter sp. TaxID=1965321 RepID=UPI003EE2BAC8
MAAQARFGVPRLKELGLPIGTLIPGLVGLAVVPLSFLFFLWWQDTTPRDKEPVQELTVTSASPAATVAEPEQEASVPDVALSSPGRLEADAGTTIAFPIAIDKAEALPERSLVAVSALPQGASFSQGRPYGETGWSLRPDEIAGLQMQLPAQGGAANMRVELITGDGTVLAQSTTELSITPPQVAIADPVEPAPQVESARMERATGATANEIAPAEVPAPAAETASASAELKGSVAESEPVAQQETFSSAASEPDVKVNTVKTVAVAPPHETKPYDGAMALGSPADAPQATEEWMEIKTAVDMHARAEQKSETVNVAQGGLKVRVTGRDKNWIQVNDPKSGTTGWIYNRFLKPADAPAQ